MAAAGITFEDRLNETIGMLRRHGRVSYRALKRQFGIDDAYVEDLKAELVEVLELAVDQGGKLLVWKGAPEPGVEPGAPAHARAPDPTAAAQRRQLTVMFCDLVGSTALSAQLDPEDLRDVLRRYQEQTAESIQRFGGAVAQYLGDGILAYFGYPQAHEDDAQRAVRAGLGIVEAMREPDRARQQAAQPLAVRIGIHTGAVVVGEVGGGERREQLALGETPNVAAKLQGLAAPGTVLVTEATRRLLRDAFVLEPAAALEIKGRPDPVAAFRVLRERDAEQLPGAAAPGSPIVGRDAEIGLLAERWAQSKEGAGQVVLLSGEAGIGKSRLLEALRERIEAEEGVRITFRCSPYFTSSALYPVISHLQRLLGFRREDPAEERLAKLERLMQGYRTLGAHAVALFAALLSVPLPEARARVPPLTPQQQKRETESLLTGWLLEEATRHPVFVAFEDLHWGDPSSVELLAQLIEQAHAARMMLLVTFRPDFRPAWTGRTYVSQLMLGRLGRAHVEELVARVVRGKALPAEVMQHVAAKTDGVPLFVEELLKMLLESGLMREESGEYRMAGPLRETAIPTTLQDLLMARLDRLDAAREIAQIGAALGREFSHELLRAVAQVDESALEQGLARLAEAELILRRGHGTAARYVFKHALIRDAAYQSLLRSRRSLIHDRIARVMEERFPEIRETQPELLAHHYTEAGLAEQAVAWWQRASQRAIARSAYVEAIHHLATALELRKSLPVTPKTVHQELYLQTSHGLALTATKGYAAPELEAIYARARELSRQIGDSPEIMPLLNGQWSFYLVRARYQMARELGEHLLRLAELAGSPVGLIEAHRALGVTLLYPGELEAGVAHLQQAIGAYDPSQHRKLAFRFTGLDVGVSVLSFLAWGTWLLGHPSRALQHSTQMLAMAREVGHPYSLAWALSFSAWLHQYRREPELAHSQAQAAITVAKEHGFALFEAMGTMFRGWAVAMSGKAGEGAAELQRGIEGYRRTGAESSRAHWLVLLAETYLADGRIEAGLAALDEANIEQTGERYYEAELHRLRGELLRAKPGRDARADARAEACFRRALEVARGQRARSLELRAALSLGRHLRRQGDGDEARAAVADVHATFSEGFDTPDLREAAAFLQER